MLIAALILASVTDKLAEFATNVVGDLGLPGIFLLMVPESACIPIPSEATMLFAGFNVSEGKYSLVAAVLVGSVANLIGSWIAYAIGYYGRTELLERHKIFHVKPEQLALTERWFERWGIWAVFFSRMLPIVRTFISLPAGAARMPFWRFSAATFAGCVPWILMLTLVGKAARDNWTEWKDRLHYVDYGVAAIIVLAIGYFGAKWWQRRRARRVAATDVA
ncbi:MAG TPA: DedA family protein [Baekduia sp.]|uniref:DedA family protein n=1 Tax=Baekduia sp. TaxID=2600305 RepID=UPI002D78517C|nr:DedA family protein [Baekduia sp.]HET6508900.1 DedA family protein [Baekduia sp.]